VAWSKHINANHQQRYFNAAAAAGCPQDQIERFAKAGYVSLSPLLAFHRAARDADKPDGPVMLGLGGTRGSAKSHAAIAQAAIDDCQRCPGLKGLFLRRTQKAAGEQFQDLIDKVLRGVNCKKNTEKVQFPNGSKIIIGGIDDPRDIDKYIGIEYDLIYPGEIGQIPGDRILQLRGSLRTAKPNWRPRLYCDFNPGGIGYQDVKALFITPWRQKQETDTRFFECWYRDNPFIDDGYRKYLEGLTGILARQWRDNDWDIFAGRAFPELQQATHGFTDELPASWPVVVGYDWGYNTSPHTVIFARMDPDGRFWIFHEIYGYGGEGERGVDESVEVVKDKVWDFLKQNEIKPLIHLAGPDFFAKGAASGMMVARAYADVFSDSPAIYLTEMPTPGGSRLQGKMAVHSRLEKREGQAYPGLMIHSTACPHTWRTMSELTYDENGSGDVDSSGPDHIFDAIKHMARWRAWGKPAHVKPMIDNKMTRRERIAAIAKAEARGK
jgi:PBSX family phage terminase large subunit